MVSFWNPCWLILVSFWDSFCFIFVPFWVTLGTSGPLWTPWEPPGKRDLIWDPLLKHFGVTFGTPWGPLGRPLGTPREQDEAQRLSQEGSREGSQTRPQKCTILGPPPGRCSGELSLKREHRFQEFRGVAFGTHFGTILGAFWTPGAPLFSPRGPKGGTEGVQKGVPKGGRFLTPLFDPKWTPK